MDIPKIEFVKILMCNVSNFFLRLLVLKGHRHNVTCCSADPDGNILVSSGWDNSVRLWSVRDGRSLSVIEDFRCPVNCIDHHPMKQQIACGLWNGNIEILDTISLKRTLILSSFQHSVKCIAYTPDGLNIISTFINSDVVIWSSERGIKMSNLKGHTLPVKSLSFSDLGNLLVSGSDDCSLKVWPTGSGVNVATITSCKLYPISLLQIISPHCLAIAFQNSEIWILDIFDDFIICKLMPGPDVVSCFSKYCSRGCVSEDLMKSWIDSSLVFGAHSGEIMIGNFGSSSLVSLGKLNSTITAIVHNESFIFCGNADGDIGIFSYPDGHSKIVYGAHKVSLTALSLFTQNGNLWAMSAANDKELRMWKIDDQTFSIDLINEVHTKHSDHITSCLPYSLSNGNKNGIAFLTGAYDNNIILQVEEDHSLFRGLTTRVLCVDYNETFILGCGSDGSVALWSKDGKLSCHIPGVQQSSVVLSFYISNGLNSEFDITLAFVDKDGSIKIQKPILRTYQHSLEGHSKGVTSCCMNSEGEVVSCSFDGTVNIWKVPSDIPEKQFQHSANVTNIILSESSKLAISSDAVGNLFLWNVDYSSKSSLKCVTKKTYSGGFITALSWLKDNKFVCAVSQILVQEEKFFLDVFSLEILDSSYNIKIVCTHYFDSEILCLDACSESETMVAGFKSGSFVVITPNVKKLIKTPEDWILGAKVLLCDSTEYIFTCLLNGLVKCFETSEILKKKYSDARCCLYQSSDVDDGIYTSAFWCLSKENVVCGDTLGCLRIYSNDIASAPRTIKIHDDVITGIAAIGPYFFTCSKDRTLKGFNCDNFKQVCQFHTSIPISCLVGREVKVATDVIYLLMIGTTSGAVHLLQYHPML